MNDDPQQDDTGDVPEPTASTPGGGFPSWEEFEGRLASALVRMAVDTYLVISARDADRQTTYYVQFAQGGRSGFRAEAVSNLHLAGTLALSPAQEEQMGDLGWQWPSPRGTADLNFSRQWPMPAPFDDVARLAVRTLREVYGVESTPQLAYKSFARGGHAFAQPGLGIDAEQPGTPRGAGQAAPATLEDLQPLVERAIRDFLNTDAVVRDEVGNIPIRMGSAMVFVRTIEGPPPSVQVFSPVLREVKGSPALFEAVNEINTRIRFGRVMWTGREVMAALEVSAVRISAEQIAFACLQVGSIADHFDDELQARFGGTTMFEGRRSLVN